jgi:hypothetical protein
MLETIWQDIRHGARMLAKNPGFSLTAILSIAIGVGANAAMFSVADGLIFRPLPIPDASGLMDVIGTTPTGEDRNIELSYPDYADLRDRAQSFEGLAALDGMIAGLSLRRDEPAQGTFGQAVSANFFDLLHVRPALGRWFVADEDRVGRDAVVVLAYETWREQFGADSAIVGREIRLSGQAFTVVGVAPEGFTGADHFVTPAFYVPLTMVATLDADAASAILEQRDQRRFRVVGRLKSDASLEQARLEVERIAGALQQEHPATNERRGLPDQARNGLPIRGVRAGRCAQRHPDRPGDYGPAGRLRQRRRAAHESRAGAGARACVEAGYRWQPRSVDASIDHRERVDRGDGRIGRSGRRLRRNPFVPAVSDRERCPHTNDLRIGSAGAAGRTRCGRHQCLARECSPGMAQHTIPRSDHRPSKHRSPASRVARLWGRHGLVATQIALTLVLLTVALSFYRAFEAEYGRGPGFRTDHILLTNLDPSFARYDQRQSDTFYRLLKERAAAIPGVTSVALTSFVPLSQDSGGSLGIVPEGVVLPPGVERLTVAAARVDDAYFDTVGVAIVSGRAFRATDTLDAPLVANRQSWHGAPVLARRGSSREANSHHEPA